MTRASLAVFALLSFALSGLLFPAPAAASDEPEPPSPKERYVELSTAGNHAGLVALWKQLPDKVIPVIDSDLERSLAIWEKDGEAKRAEIDALIARAIAGAHAAVDATGRRRVLDYVTSFAGWTAAEKKDFRAGQKAFGAASKALKEKEFDTALEQGRRCLALAEPLGDWWGTAMGLQAEGMALAGLGRKAKAVTALSRARLIYRELGLTSSALRIEASLAAILIELDRQPRAKAMIHDGLATAKRLDKKTLIEAFTSLGTKLGDRKSTATSKPRR